MSISMLINVILVVGIILAVVKAIRKRSDKKANDSRRQMLHQQQEMFKVLLAKQNGVVYTPSRSLANGMATQTAPESKRRFSIGWIVFFVCLAFVAYFFLKPYFEVLSVVGPRNFFDIFFSGRF